jgi:hypothetical protein
MYLLAVTEPVFSLPVVENICTPDSIFSHVIFELPGYSNQPETYDTDHRGDSGLNDIQEQECSSRHCNT